MPNWCENYLGVAGAHNQIQQSISNGRSELVVAESDQFHRSRLLPAEAATMNKITQFNWSRHWKKKVEPHLEIPLVRASVEIWMRDLDPTWTWEDGPHAVGRGRWNGQRVTKNKL